MTSILAHLTLKPGIEARFEEIARDLTAQTIGKEPDCLRYEYWRGGDPRRYYILLSYPNSHTFYEHQASDWHEGLGPGLRECCETIRLEILDPVPGACPMPPTETNPLPPDAPEALRRQEAIVTIERNSWWDTVGA